MTRRTSPSAALTALAALLLAMLWTAVGSASDAHAAARVTIANEFGEARADTTYSTEITVSGSGFQSVQGAFGGVYVFFGTVGTGWQPSKGGKSGVNFRYVPDSESQNNSGFQRFVAYPGSSTADEAHATMSDSGGWTVTMTVPGPTFQTVGRSGGTETVDCLKVTCGVITVGAHGVTNAQNETFTPVSFADIYSSTPAPTDPPSTAPDTESDDGTQVPGDEEAGADDDAAATDDAVPDVVVPTEPTLDVDRATAVVGRVMTFTAQGFTPGEQVVGSLGAGLAAVGPLVAGAQGEVAGVLQLPADLRAGTQRLALTGAASGSRAELEFQVAAAPAVPVPPTEEADEGATGLAWEWIALGVAALVLVVVIAVGVVTATRERRARRRTAAPVPDPTPDTAPTPTPAPAGAVTPKEAV